MTAGIILLAALVCAFVAATTAFGIVLYLSEPTTDVDYEVKARGWWEANTTITVHPEHKGFRQELIDELGELSDKFDHDSIQLAADTGMPAQIETEPTK